MMFGTAYDGFNNCFGLGAGLMYGGWGMITMLGITVIAFIGIIVLARKKGKHDKDNAVFETLRMKLAKGEISIEEYSKRKMVLE
jgi:uncharacterized membrane protein